MAVSVRLAQRRGAGEILTIAEALPNALKQQPILLPTLHRTQYVLGTRPGQSWLDAQQITPHAYLSHKFYDDVETINWFIRCIIVQSMQKIAALGSLHTYQLTLIDTLAAIMPAQNQQFTVGG